MALVGAGGWFLEPGTVCMETRLIQRPGPQGVTSEQEVPVEARGPWSEVWSGLAMLCNINPRGIRSCNRRGEVTVRSLSMLTLCIPAP